MAPFLLTLLAVGCGGDASAGATDGPDDPVEGTVGFQRVINVEVSTLEPEPFREWIRITGTVKANQDVTVAAEEAGVVRELLVDRGSRVRQGDALIRIDDGILRSQVREAEARSALARENWERRRRLFEEDGVGAELPYLEARYQAEQAEAQVATLQDRLARTVIRAPVTGLVDDRMVEVGSMVAPGTPALRVVQVDQVKVTGGVPERFAEDVHAGAAARVRFDVLGGQAFEARIRFVGATVNPRNRTFEVELLVPNPGEVIKPEMVANLEIPRRDLEEALVIPQNALVRVEEGFVVFVAEGEGDGAVARVRSLRLGPSQRNLVVVEEGLEAGDRLIVVGQNQVADGDRIRVVGERAGTPPATNSEGGDR